MPLAADFLQKQQKQRGRPFESGGLGNPSARPGAALTGFGGVIMVRRVSAIMPPMRVSDIALP